MELNIKKQFGLMFETRLYVVDVPYREDRGAMFHLPLEAAQMANLVVDLSNEEILKCRFEKQTKWELIVPGIIVAFKGIPTSTLSELKTIEPMVKHAQWW